MNLDLPALKESKGLPVPVAPWASSFSLFEGPEALKVFRGHRDLVERKASLVYPVREAHKDLPVPRVQKARGDLKACGASLGHW